MTKLFQDWADQAAERMWFPPDRKIVRQELLDHMEDAREALLAQGLTDEAAQQKAVEAMGNAKAVGKALNRVHRPVLGWMWLVSKWVSIFMVVLVVLQLWVSGRNPIRDMVKDAFFIEECEQHWDQQAPIQSGLKLEEGDYTIQLHHGAFSVMEENIGMELGLQIHTDQLWQVWPRGLKRLRVELSTGVTGWEQNRDDGVWVRVQVEGNSILPVWKAHVFVEAWSEEPVEWVRFYVPDTDIDFTVWMNGEVTR